MNYKQHLTYGFIALVALSIILFFIQIEYDIPLITTQIYFISFVSIPILIPVFIIGLYASIFPDIDIRTSKAFSVFIIAIVIGILISVTIDQPKYMIFCLILLTTVVFLNHRGIMHRWYTGLVIGIIISVLMWQPLYGLYFTTGYFTHLICDYANH